MGDITDELKDAQGGGEKKENTNVKLKLIYTADLIKLPSVNMIFGDVGQGKSGLAYEIMEKLSTKHDLLPVVINLPEDKRSLLPPNYIVTDLDGLNSLENCIVLIDEGTTNIPAGSKDLEEMIKGFNSLVRQRNQIIVFIFHSSSDAGSRVLRGINGALIFKKPNRRQIQWGSKDKVMFGLMTESLENCKALEAIGENSQEWALVDNLDPDYHGMARNGLPSYWSDDLSKAWKGHIIGTGSPNTSQKTNKPMTVIDMFKARDTDLETIDQYFDRLGVPPEKRDLICKLDGEYTGEELKRICVEQNIPISGDKKKLVWRLMEAGYFEGKV